MERGTIIHGFSQSGLDYQPWSFLCFLMATELSPMLSGSTRQGGRRMLWIQFVMIILIFQDLQKQIWSHISCFLMTIFTNTDFNKSKQHQQPIPDSLLLCWQNPLPHWCLQCTSWFGVYLGVSLCCTSLICCLCLSEEVNRMRKIFFDNSKVQSYGTVVGIWRWTSLSPRVPAGLTLQFAINSKCCIQQPYQVRLPSSFNTTALYKAKLCQQDSS